MLWTILVFGVIIGWFIASIKIVGPDEIAIRVILGKPVSYEDSGFKFVPFFFGCFLKRYPKKMYNFDFKEREVVTQAGEYISEEEKKKDPDAKEIHYGSQVLKVTSVVYLNFPRDKRGQEVTGDALADDVDMIEEDAIIKGIKKRTVVEKTHPLIKILRAQVPSKDEELKGWTEEAVLGALRVAFGKMTWMRAVSDIGEVTKQAVEVFTKTDGALIRAGFSKKGIQLVIAEIKLPPALQQAMPGVDQQRLQAEAAGFEAKQRAIEAVGAVVEMFCELTGRKQNDVQQQLKDNSKTFIEQNKEMWDKSWDIVHRRMGIDGRAYIDIRTGNAISDLITLWQMMSKRQGGGKGEGEEEKPEGKGVKFPGGETRTLSDKERKRRGLSF